MVKHFSHRHELCPFQVQEDEEELICSGCELDLNVMSSSTAYKCSNYSKCQFYLHDLCFELPREIRRHPSHPKHPLSLTLFINPPYKDSEFTCDACGESGTCFTFHCIHCKYDLHVQCATLPETVSCINNNQQHPQHLLTLLYSLPTSHENNKQDNKKEIICVFCQGTFPPQGCCWVYYCKDCDHSAHLDCCIAHAQEEYKQDQIIISS